MPSKYDKVLPGLPKAPVADQTYQDKVDEVKRKIGPQKPETLARAYAALCLEDEKVKAAQYDVNLRFAALEQMIAASQDAKEDGWGKYGAAENMIRLENGGSIRVQVEPYGQVRDKEAFRQWCIANGYERQLQLWPSTMNTLCKERLLEAQPLPEGCDAFQKTKVIYTAPPMPKEK